MKRKGSTSDFIPQRNRELTARFRELLATAEGVPLRDMFGMAARQPCSRFWVAEERAAEVVSAILRGGDTSSFLPQKKRMYEEICRRVEAYRRRHPEATLADAAHAVVNGGAPEFYLTPDSAMVIIYKSRRKKPTQP